MLEALPFILAASLHTRKQVQNKETAVRCECLVAHKCVRFKLVSQQTARSHFVSFPAVPVKSPTTDNEAKCAECLLSLLYSTSVICPKTWKLQKTHLMSIKAVGGGVQMLEAVSAVKPLTAIVVAEAKGSITFPSFLRIAIFSHLGCQCLITGFMRRTVSLF